MDFLLQTINVLADLIITLIFLRIIMSWFVRRRNRGMQFLMDVTEPILGPIRRALPRFGMLDLSPLVAFVLIELVRGLLNTYLLPLL